MPLILKYLFCLFFFLFVCISTKLTAQVEANRTAMEIEVLDSYESLVADKVTCNLLINYKNYLDSPNEYWNFLNETFLVNWDFDATTKALVGSKIFDSLSNMQFKELSKTLKVTLMRYAFESLSYYSEQRLTVIDIKVSKQQTFAWLKINMDSPRFPDIHLDLLLRRTNHSQWKGVDFRFKGVTYVNLKKNGYREDFKKLKFKGLLRKLQEKNKVFFKDLCNGEANYIDADQLPCL